MYRQKKYITGNFLEAEVFVRPENVKKFKRAKKVKESSTAQINLNNKKAERYFIRFVHANFTEEDLYLDLTFEGDYIPKTRKEVRRLVKNYLERLRYYRKMHGLGKLKYVYVISNMDNNGNKVRLHCHLIINDVNRDDAEALWQLGYANTQRLEFNEYGVTGKSLYMARQAGAVDEDDIQPGEKSWGHSVGMKRPEPIVSDKAFIKKEVDRALRNPEDRQFFEKKFPGWVFTDCVVDIDDYNGTSLLIRMRKYDGPRQTVWNKSKMDRIADKWLSGQKDVQLTMDIKPTKRIG